MRKHLLYLTNNRLTARIWQGGRFTVERVFENDESGWLDFRVYLDQYEHVQVRLLIDLIEEDFHRDTIPHVVGKSKKALIERRLVQLYRDTPFRYAGMQGREKGGRRDDRMLFSALTNAALIKPWIDAILKAQVPLAGIFSTALLSTALFNKLQLGTGAVLFITHQSAGLRQSYFQDGFLKFSRLTQLPSQDPDAVAEVANLEIGKARQFLANTRLLQRGDSLNIVALDNIATLKSLQALNADSAAVAYHYIDLEEATRVLGLKNLVIISVSDALFLTLLCNKPPASHYTLFEQSRAYTMWQLRLVLYIFSGATLLGGLFWADANMMETFDTVDQLNQLERDTQTNQKRYQNVIKSMPKTIANPHDMKSAVDLEQIITQNAPTPNAILVTISQALEALPQLNLKELNWEVSDNSTPTDSGVSAPVPSQLMNAPPSAALIGVPAKPVEIVVIKGEVLPFQNDYRSALESVNQFSAILMKDKNIQVSITRPPLDIRPSVSLTGQAGSVDSVANADFEIRLVWRH